MWSPDGRRIAYTSMRTVRTTSGSINADGTGPARRSPASLPDRVERPRGPRDGTRIAYERDRHLRDRSPRRHRADARAAPSRSGRFLGADRPDWSPDGSEIVFATFSTTTARAAWTCFARRPDGTGGPRDRLRPRMRRHRDVSDPAAWSPDGTRIVLGDRTAGCSPSTRTARGSTDTPSSSDRARLAPLRGHRRQIPRPPRQRRPFRVPLVPAAKPCTSEPHPRPAARVRLLQPAAARLELPHRRRRRRQPARSRARSGPCG